MQGISRPFLLSLKMSFTVLISIYCCKCISRKCEIGMSWIAPQSSGALKCCLQCGVGQSLRESCPDGCQHRAELQVFVSGAERRGKFTGAYTITPCILTKLTRYLSKQRGSDTLEQTNKKCSQDSVKPLRKVVKNVPDNKMVFRKKGKVSYISKINESLMRADGADLQ